MSQMMNKFEHDLVVITSENEIDDSSQFIQVKQGYTITIGNGGSAWTLPQGVTHIILYGCGGGSGSK